MFIIIAGCGKVGMTLAGRLSTAGHDVTVIDIREERIERVTDSYDVSGLAGNAVSHETQMEAGIRDADLMIAVTGSDEKNLLACMIARRTGGCRTIARVRDPLYTNENEFIKREFGLAVIVNPELAAAREIAGLFQFPTARRIERFTRSEVELVHFTVKSGSVLDGESILRVRTDMNDNILVCTVMRGDEMTVPDGTLVFREGDVVGILGKRPDLADFLAKAGVTAGRVRNAMIAGGGSRTGYYLARELMQTGISVTIIEKDPVKCDELSDAFPKANIILGDVTDEELLEQEGIAHYHGFAAITGMDEENILLSKYVKEKADCKVATKVSRMIFEHIIRGMELDSIINPQEITADYIEQFVRSMDESLDSEVENLYKLEGGRAEALEFYIKENSPVTGIMLKDMKLRKDTLICSISREGKTIIPSGTDTLEPGDFVVIVSAGHGIGDVADILKR